MILVIDNYDSFTYNLVQLIGSLVPESEIQVFRHDAITVDEVAKLAPDQIVISPGPGRPSESGISPEIVRRFAPQIPILGVCLGHQVIGEVYGGRITGAQRILHGKTSKIFHSGDGLYGGLPNPFTATRYHSLIIDTDSLPDCLELTAWTQEGEIMGIRHKAYPAEGVQFHPESILTHVGRTLLASFLNSVEQQQAC